MRFLSFIFIVFSFSLTVQAKNADDCACEELKCNPCERQVDIKFVAEKCGPGKSQVKSCKKPVCQLMDPLPKMCWAKYGKPKSEKMKAQKKFKKKKSDTVYKKVRAHVGVVMMVRGLAWVTPESGKPKKAKVGLKVFEKDTIETAEDAKVRVLFKDKNVMNVTAKSKAVIASMVHRRRGIKDHTMIDLIHGKIRSKVQQKYKGSKNNYYRVRTKAAVAGVRGTDFVVSYFEDAAVETHVQTLEGTVALAARQGKNDDGILLEEVMAKNRVEIGKGTHAKFVIDKSAMGTDVFSEDDIQNFVARGYMTPVYQLSENELKILDAETDFNEMDRQVASAKASKVCRAPSAPLNHCAWTCKGSTGGKKCRTDLPGVSCVRKRCNANGKWAEETRLPASFSRYCDGRKTVVKPCDY